MARPRLREERPLMQSRTSFPPDGEPHGHPSPHVTSTFFLDGETKDWYSEGTYHPKANSYDRGGAELEPGLRPLCGE